MIKSFALAIVLSVLATTYSQTSPCPELFEYKSTGPNHWVGNLNVVSEYKLYGTWIRLIFDKPVKSLVVDKNQLEVKQTEPTGILLKNRDLTLLKGQPVKVQFTVSYDGTDVPSLVGYRLNARDICPGSDD